MKKKHSKSIFILLIVIFFLLVMLLLYNSKEITSSFYYPYDDIDYLNVSNIKKCTSDKELEQSIEGLIINSFLDNDDIIEDTHNLISYDNYIKLKSAASIDSHDFDLRNYHCNYINSMCFNNRAVIIFETTFIQNYYSEYDKYTYYNKVYLKKGKDTDWYVYDVYISPTGWTPNIKWLENWNPSQCLKIIIMYKYHSNPFPGTKSDVHKI